MIISQSVGLIESLEYWLVMNKWDLGILAMQALTSLEFIESILSLICKVSIEVVLVVILESTSIIEDTNTHKWFKFMIERDPHSSWIWCWIKVDLNWNEW